MTNPQMQPHDLGSNQGATKILLCLVFGSVFLGGTWSLLGPGHRLIGTWQQTEGSSYDIFRFDADGSYWQHTYSGLFSVHLVGTYEIITASAETYRVRVKTQIGEGEMALRLESPDRLISLDSDSPKESRYERVGDWVLAMHPSSTPSTYGGATPHLGCWQRQGVESPELELLAGGSLIRYSGGEAERATYSVDYSKVPFRLDITDGGGQVDKEIFDFAAGGALRISQTHSDGGRPKEMKGHQTYFPCPKSASQGAS